MSRAATTCAACGAKIRAGRGRCPRCRAVIVAADPAAAAARSRRLLNVAGGIAMGFVVVTGVLWLTSGPAPVEPPPAAVRTDPFAARRPAAPAPEAAAAPARPAAVRPFLDASGAGATSYAAGNFTTALEKYQEAVERNPMDAESLSNLGQVLVRLQRAPEAIPYFERAVAIIPNRWAYQFNHARAQGLVGRWDLAAAGYRRAQALFPEDYATAFNLGQALQKAGDEAGAVEAYQRAIVLEPNDASFRMALGMAFERLQKPAEAAAAYREALRLAPDAPDADKVHARIAELTAPAAGRGGS